MPSEVFTLLSLRLVGVCMKKPPAPTAVTMLSFVVAIAPMWGLSRSGPWMTKISPVTGSGSGSGGGQSLAAPGVPNAPVP